LLLDSNVIDAAVADDAFRTAMIAAATAGTVQLLITHVQIDEILDTPVVKDVHRSALVRVLAEIPAERIPTYGFIIGLSRLDNARVTDDEGAAFIETLRAGNPSRTRDAVLIATARYEKATFVSNDRRARNTALRNGVAALSPAELVPML
jgi:predicted nucleic acid-binding protein